MRAFSYARAFSTEEAITLAGQPGTHFLAGGTSLIDLMRAEVEVPARLVDINALPLAEVALGEGALRVGALARMSDVAADPAVRERTPALAQALLAGAAPQLRNAATVGGNLMQRTRCPYFAGRDFACNKRRPGSGCDARAGEHRGHAVLGASPHCIAAHPSDMAVALAALEATVQVVGPRGPRAIPVDDFHLPPGDTPERETALEPQELVVAVQVPVTALGARSLYVKVRDRASYAFALASAAVALEVREGTIADARVALGGVATRPWRSREAEAALRGRRPQPSAFAEAAERALAGARTLPGNAYKVELAKRVVVRALRTLVEAGGR